MHKSLPELNKRYGKILEQILDLMLVKENWLSVNYTV